ncbi:hypothetical protein ES703_08284 [subsurface metagenome]
MASPNPFERFINQDVKLVFHDGPEVRVQRGRLISVSEGFATIETPNGIVAISISEIVKIRENEGGRHE